MTSNTPTPPTASSAQPLSYASATKKAAQQSASQSPAVAVGNAAQAQNGKSSPANGKPAAVPVVSTPVVNGDHSRQASVTINGAPVANGSTNASKTPIQFGSLAESPAVSHSTPHVAQSDSAPIAIPSNPRVTSPAQSPSPIPQPAVSGGKPPTTVQSGGMTFGSHPGGDGDRHMRQASMPQVPLAPGAQPGHDRRPSGESGMGAPGRGGFTPGGRGRGYSNNYQQGGHMAYQGNNQQFRGAPQQGRGGMPGQFQGQGRPMQPYQSSPHQGPARSPALTNSVPTTPNMGQAMPMQTQHYGGYQPQYMGAPQTYGYPPQMQYDHRMSGQPMYPNMQYPMQFMPGMGAPQSPQPGYQQPFVPGQYNAAPQPQAMSRTSSQISERPASALGPQTPSTAPSALNSTPAAKAATPAYVRPARKSAALVIKNADGEIVQLPSAKAAPSPAPTPSTQTPPVVSTPTPPARQATPQHIRVESKASADVAKEFREKVRLAAEEDAAKDKATAPKVVAETKPVEAKVEEPKPKAEEEKEEKKDTSEVDAAAAAAKAKQDEEDELERQIQEMEAAEAEREKKEAELLEKRKAEKAKADAESAEKNKVSAAENDAKLREQEREMERIEDERAAKRAAAEAGGEEKKDDAPLTPSTLASKVAAMKIGETGTSSPASDDSMGPPPKPSAAAARKPAALNLAGLNSKPVEPAQPSAALKSLKSAHFLIAIDPSIYPEGIQSPNPALNPSTKGKTFKYNKDFLMQFKDVFTEKPSLEFEAQIKALIGDGTESRQGSTRGSMGPRAQSKQGSFPPAMGAFGSGKTLPPGTTSAQRFAMAQGAVPRPGGGPIGGFSSTGASFGGGMSGGRNASMGPNSPRNANPSRGGRQGSKRDAGRESKPNHEAEKKMPLTAGMVLKPIEVTASGWKPRSVMAQASATGAAGPAPGGAPGQLMDPEMVQRKVKAALNKMTPEKFDKIADQILTIAAQSKEEQDGRTLRQVIQLTFEKATDEAHWASMYAKFCKRMLETMSPEIRDESILDKNGNVVSGGNLFRKYLLNRCQEEFERGWKMDLGEKPEGEKGDEKTGEAAMLSDEYYIAEAAKRRGLGLVQFIGELYKLGMLTERIMHECVKKLVDFTGIPDEAEIESLTKLLKTIGGNLDSTEKGRPMMDVYFSRIQAMIDIPELPSRLKYMLMDIVDLRAKRWVSKESNKGPKTLDEIRAEAEAAAAQKAAENARGPRGGGGGGGGRMQMGRGDGRQFSNYGNQPPIDYTKNTVATDDLRRLGNKAAARNTGGPMSFAPTSMFSSRSNSNRKMGPGGSLMSNREDSNGSRTGTPPQQKEKESVAVKNAFDLLQDLEDHHEETPASPPSVASPELTKSSLANEEKKEE